jgi:nitrate reductase gamma subunit
VYQSVSHTLMKKCPEKGRWLGHWLLALGTVMMLTIKVFALRWFQTDNIYPLYNPQRWLGYLAAGFIFYGVGDILVQRVKANKEIYKETRMEDLIFPVLLLLTAVSGMAAHILRYSGLGYAALITYGVHVIIATPMLVVEMPFGSWAHMIYRPLALYFQAVKERAAQLVPAGEAIGHVV